MKYIVIAKKSNLSTVISAYRRVYLDKDKAINDYVEKMADADWNVVTAQVTVNDYISMTKTALFLYEANEHFLQSSL